MTSPPAYSLMYRQAGIDDSAEIALLMDPDVQARKLLRRTDQELIDLTKHGFVAEHDSQKTKA